jgi:hypothetical protein
MCADDQRGTSAHKVQKRHRPRSHNLPSTAPAKPRLARAEVDTWRPSPTTTRSFSTILPTIPKSRTISSDDQQQDQQDPAEEDDIVFSDDPVPPGRERQRVIKHLRDELKSDQASTAERPAPQAPKIEVGPRPTLEGCEWDEDKHADALDAWYDRKRQAEQQETAEQKQRKANETFQADVQRFEGARASLKVAGAPEAIDTALASLSPVQQAVIVKAADNAATVAAALGKHPARLAEVRRSKTRSSSPSPSPRWKGRSR